MTDPFEYWFPWYPARFKSKTMHLSPEQDGIYRRLIDHYMETRAPLPENNGALARIAGCPVEIIEENASSILDAFFMLKDGLYYHKTCNERLDEQDAKSRKRTRIAKSAAKKRWSQEPDNKQENASSMPDAMLPDATGEERKGKDKTGYKKEKRGELQKAVELYNDTADKIGLAVVQKLSDTRKKNLNARLKDCEGLDGWKHALSLLEASSFCRGDNDRGWKADFDFILRESSFIKLMEGKYNDHTGRNDTDRTRDKFREWAETPVVE